MGLLFSGASLTKEKSWTSSPDTRNEYPISLWWIMFSSAGLMMELSGHGTFRYLDFYAEWRTWSCIQNKWLSEQPSTWIRKDCLCHCKQEHLLRDRHRKQQDRQMHQIQQTFHHFLFLLRKSASLWQYWEQDPHLWLEHLRPWSSRGTFSAS